VNYDFEMPGLAEAVARAPVEPKHAALLDAVRSHRSLNNAKVGAWRNGLWLSRRKVVTAAGQLVHNDHEGWLSSAPSTPATLRKPCTACARSTT
jgi:hypothetical protein